MRTYIFGLIILAAFTAGLISGGMIGERTAGAYCNTPVHEGALYESSIGGNNDFIPNRIDYRDRSGSISFMETDHVTDRTSD